MPAKPKTDTLARLLELLQAIPHRRFASPEELTQALNARGYSVHVRTVQRDLQLLREHLPLDVRDDSKPHGWGWKAQPPDGIAGIGASEALMVSLVERHLLAALPASMLETFKPTFDRAHKRLTKLGQRAGAANWAEKVAAVPPALSGLAPSVSRPVKEAISEALLLDRQLQCLYRTALGGAAKAYRLHPIGVVLRANAVYLVATKGFGTAPAYFAMHRFDRAEVRLEPVEHESGLTLEVALRRTKGQFGVPSNEPALLRLHLTCSDLIAAYLAESPLSEDQAIARREDGAYDVRLSLPDSWELRWWLLSRGTDVEVLSPKPLRREIATALKLAVARYSDA